MNEKYLLRIDQFISMGNEVLGTMRIQTNPERTIKGHNALGEEYVQRIIPISKYEFVDNGKYKSWITGILAYLQTHFQYSAAEYIKRVTDESSKPYFTNGTCARVITEIVVGFRSLVESGIIQPDALIRVNIYCLIC